MSHKGTRAHTPLMLLSLSKSPFLPPLFLPLSRFGACTNGCDTPGRLQPRETVSTIRHCFMRACDPFQRKALCDAGDARDSTAETKSPSASLTPTQTQSRGGDETSREDYRCAHARKGKKAKRRKDDFTAARLLAAMLAEK